MKAIRREAMVILYKNDHDLQGLKESLNKFCVSNNVSIIDIVTITDKYEYLTLKRIFQIIKFSPQSMSLIVNGDLLNIMPLFIIMAILEAFNSNDTIDIIIKFLKEYKEKVSKIVDREEIADSHKKLNLSLRDQNLDSFRVVPSYEIETISEWISEVKYKIVKSQKQATG